MKALLTIALIFCSCLFANAQDIHQLKNIKPHEAYDNILVKKLYSDPESTTFIIWVKDFVKPHYHEHHTEQLFVISGKGEMDIDGKISRIKKGDFFIIPKGVPHSVKVVGRKPLKVLSVQAPEFLGKDRVFVE